MKTALSLQLEANQPRRLKPAQGAHMRVESGIVWLTVSGMADDVFLHAGESYRIPARGRMLVESLHGPALVSLAPPRWRPIEAMIDLWRRLLPKLTAAH